MNSKAPPAQGSILVTSNTGLNPNGTDLRYRTQRAITLAERFASSTWLVLFLFTSLYLVPTLWIASHKLLWDDEFYTLYISKAEGWHGILRALSTGADQHPPSFYYLNQVLTNFAGTSHITLRLPAIFGFWLMCVCLYFVVRELTNPVWGGIVLLMPLMTEAYYYASEARGYGLMLGFCAIALLAWFQATRDFRRKIFVPLLALGLAGAVSSHYYAILALFPLCAGEIVRTVSRRKIDIPVWLAFTAPVAPLLIFLPTVRSARGYSSHFWALPHWVNVFDYYPKMLALLVDGSLAAVFIILLFRTSRWSFGRVGQRPAVLQFRPWHAVAFGAFVVLPLVVMLLAKFVTHGYVERYALPALLGAMILGACFLHDFADANTIPGVGVAFVCVGFFGLNVAAQIDNNSRIEKSSAIFLQLLSVTGIDQVVLSEITLFHRLSFYAPRAMAAKFVYLADPALSVQHLGHDTVDRGFLDLTPWFPLNIVAYGQYVREHRGFLSYGYIGTWSWLTYELSHAPFETTVAARSLDHMLLYSEDKDFNQVRQYIPAEPPPRRLYDTLKVTEPTLCEHYMGRGACPALR